VVMDVADDDDDEPMMLISGTDAAVSAGKSVVADSDSRRKTLDGEAAAAAAAAEHMDIPDDTWTDWFLPVPRCEDEFRRTGDAAAAETGDDSMGCVVAVAGSCMSTSDSQLVMVDGRRG